jgi:hypothetical protein
MYPYLLAAAISRDAEIGPAVLALLLAFTWCGLGYLLMRLPVEGLICGGCGVEFQIPAGCVIMSSHNVRSLRLAIVGHAPPSPPDMIWPKRGIRPGGRYQNPAIEQMTIRSNKAVLADVRTALARGEARRWVCGACRHENTYRFEKVRPRAITRRVTPGREPHVPL